MRHEVAIRREDITSSVAMGLIQALNRELTATYPEEGATHFRLDPDEVAEGQGAFLVAYVGGVARGCGAIRRLDPGTGEIKRMYVEPTLRGAGVGRVLLGGLESEARRLKIGRVVLETGVRQDAALVLYERCGYERIPAFGDYVDCPLSICMAKDL